MYELLKEITILISKSKYYFIKLIIRDLNTRYKQFVRIISEYGNSEVPE